MRRKGGGLPDFLKEEKLEGCADRSVGKLYESMILSGTKLGDKLCADYHRKW